MANGEKGKGRSQNQRLKLFYLLDYLLEETDETHTKKVAEIIEHFENYPVLPYTISQTNAGFVRKKA